MSPRTYFHAASGVRQIKKVRIQVLGRSICLKSTFLTESASSRLRLWWLIFNHYKLAHFCFLSDLDWVKPLLYLVRKDLSLAFWDTQFFSLLTNWMIRLLLLGATYTQTLDHKHTNGFVTFVSNLSVNIKHLFYATTQSTESI